MGRLDVSSWEVPPLPFVLLVLVVLGAVALGANVVITAVTPSHPDASVEIDFTYVENGTEVTVTLVENEHAKSIVVRTDAGDQWDDGTRANSPYDDWGSGATISESDDSTTNLLTEGSAEVTVVGTVGLLGRNEVVIRRETYRVPSNQSASLSPPPG